MSTIHWNGYGAGYAYLGLSAIIQVGYWEPQLRWSLTVNGTADNPYGGLDRFGRVIDCPWYSDAEEQYVERLQYSYDAAGNRLWRHNIIAPAGNDELYGYDGLHRLVEMARGTLAIDVTHVDNVQLTQDWTLDPTGNWNRFTQSNVATPTDNLDQSRWQNAANEITQIARRYGANWVTPAYDGAGNMTSIPKPVDPTQAFAGTYDAWNRLTTIGTSTYAYDGLNRRIRAPHESGGTRDFYYTADWRLVETRHASLPTQSEFIYIWGQRYIDDLVFLTAPTTGTSVDPPENHYALQDANWNVTAFCENTGDILERFRYTPYGVPTFLNADFEPIDPIFFRHWRILYAGYWWDRETGLYKVRRRDLQPLMGVWLTRDPIKYFGGSVNLVEYGLGTPINIVDPSGLQIFLGAQPWAIFRPAAQPVPFRIYVPPPKPFTPPFPAPSPILSPEASRRGRPDVGGGQQPQGNPAQDPCWDPSAQDMKPPGRCTQGEYDMLRQTVISKCKKGYVEACGWRLLGWSCDDYSEYEQRWTACGDARTELMKRCFGGGNANHRAEANEAYRQVYECEKLWYKWCVEPPPPVWPLVPDIV